MVGFQIFGDPDAGDIAFTILVVGINGTHQVVLTGTLLANSYTLSFAILMQSFCLKWIIIPWFMTILFAFPFQGFCIIALPNLYSIL